ncbi:LacI family DNA-binding transcriptional regulator [Amycolatopsis nigrescens]|uniref:LacI family DNA-binding transcriptional regulator n=1 Tax=Amycolatopsis nigrescens TaxID=381445 RepID=UPI000379F77A|nr:LacI family DNA-binding transcriptional regulator [Amycolatopsis nigrescens]
MTANRATLAEVARRAGVSVASASRALNGASASPEMVARVRQAADELGYVVDATARSLKVRRTEQLAFAVADLGNPVYVAMMRSIEKVVRAAGYRLVVSATGADPLDEIELIRGLHRGYADGLILSPLRITDELVAELRRAPVPVTVVGSLPPGVDIDNVRANSARGVGLAVRHLAGTGRAAIGFVNGPIDTVPGIARSRGFRRAMRALERPIAPEQTVVAADFTHDAGEKATAALLEHYRPDAILCANDLLAIGTMRLLRARGLRVPEEIAVAGMDDTELAELATPGLTSVSLGSEERGRIAATMLLDRLAEPARATGRVTVQPELVLRSSTALARGKGRR